MLLRQPPLALLNPRRHGWPDCAAACLVRRTTLSMRTFPTPTQPATAEGQQQILERPIALPASMIACRSAGV
jgi:hypothetical protein